MGISRMSEAQHQKTVIEWTKSVRGRYPELKLLFHIPNGGARDEIEGSHLKAQGVKRGVPDLCLPVPRVPYHGLFIEMKTEAGKEAEDQKWWREELTGQGYFSTVCHGWESAIRTLEWYLNLRKWEV